MIYLKIKNETYTKKMIDSMFTVFDIIEQDHRFIKKRTRPMLGFKSFRSAKITISGIENIRIIQKGQIIGSNNNTSAFENFKMLMAS
jgi:putative transposase